MLDFNAMSTLEIIDWYLQYGSPRAAAFHRNVPRRKAERILIERLGYVPRDPRITVIARGPEPGSYTWETRFPDGCASLSEAIHYTRH